ncbi:hypothetical protein B0H13DRAFT_1895793 [Mycena leptocephala]|nr:hypothetical protein B0H13DRAFT_1895793 [Mycena leptocephala]
MLVGDTDIKSNEPKLEHKGFAGQHQKDVLDSELASCTHTRSMEGRGSGYIREREERYEIEIETSTARGAGNCSSTTWYLKQGVQVRSADVDTERGSWGLSADMTKEGQRADKGQERFPSKEEVLNCDMGFVWPVTTCGPHVSNACGNHMRRLLPPNEKEKEKRTTSERTGVRTNERKSEKKKV